MTTTVTTTTELETSRDTVSGGEWRLTAHQRQALKHLPPGHRLVAIWGSTPIVRRPDGLLSRMRSSGRLVKTGGVQGVQSYLLVQG
jgi:hypothetical protein